MTDLRKAAEQALEALQYTCDYLPAKTGVERDVDDAITALRQALAQPKREWIGLTDEDFYGQSELQVMAMKYAEAKLKEKNA